MVHPAPSDGARRLPPAGTCVGGRFDVVDLVGLGGMGSVWRARDRRTGDVVALKLLDRPDDAARLLRFVREQRVRVAHPHVAAPLTWVADDEHPGFALELCRGGTVLDLLTGHGPLPASLAALLLDQLLAGLDAVHAAGVVHRDVKPANLLLAATGAGRPHLRLADFGIAAPHGAGHGHVGGPGGGPEGVAGTAGFAAPEQLAGAAPDPRQDLHAVGVVARLLLGPGTGSPALRRWAARLADPAPGRRPASAAEARRALAGCGPHPPEPWPPVPDRLGPLPGARRADPARRRTVALRAAAACLSGSLALSATSAALVLR